MGAKVAADLKRMQRLYGSPDDNLISSYEKEIVELLKAGVLDFVFYGYKREGNWIEPTLKYSAKDLSNSESTDDDPGKIRPGANISNASFHSFLSYNSRWYQLQDGERATIRASLPFDRTSGQQPGILGYLKDDLVYSSGGRALNRSTVRSF
jgi:hypothetical protein